METINNTAEQEARGAAAQNPSNQPSARRVALVTGGARGIGRAICEQFARERINVVINYAGNAAAAEETAVLCRTYGVEALTVQADVSDPEECKRLFKEAMDRFGHIDILVNNAGIVKDNLLLRMKEEDFDKVIQVNLSGAFYCMKQASRIMLKQKGGRIINISSVTGLRGNAGQMNYAASKAGIIGMTKTMAKEFATKNITVNAVAPGLIATDILQNMTEKAKAELAESIPAGRLGDPADVAGAVAFFARPEASYVTGQVLCVDGGLAV